MSIDFEKLKEICPEMVERCGWRALQLHIRDVITHQEKVLIARLLLTQSEELEGFQRLIEMQHSRYSEAGKLWQKETDNPGTTPDLGVLLGFLTARINKLEYEKELDRLRLNDLEGSRIAHTEQAETLQSHLASQQGVIERMHLWFHTHIHDIKRGAFSGAIDEMVNLHADIQKLREEQDK